MPRLLAAFPAVAGLQQIVDRIGGGVDVYSALSLYSSKVWRSNCRSFILAIENAKPLQLPVYSHYHLPPVAAL